MDPPFFVSLSLCGAGAPPYSATFHGRSPRKTPITQVQRHNVTPPAASSFAFTHKQRTSDFPRNNLLPTPHSIRRDTVPLHGTPPSLQSAQRALATGLTLRTIFDKVNNLFCRSDVCIADQRRRLLFDSFFSRRLFLKASLACTLLLAEIDPAWAKIPTIDNLPEWRISLYNTHS